MATEPVVKRIIGIDPGYAITGYGIIDKQGNKLVMKLGYSHDVIVPESDDYKFEVPNPLTIVVKGIDKQKVGEISAQIRGKRPPEPYKGKGIHYVGERIRRKAGKTGK